MNRITNITKATKAWLKPNHPGKREALEKTVEEGLFSSEDVVHQLSVLRENVEDGQIQKWAKRADLQAHNLATGKKVLCLHAGNLPLVGFQTALGTLLSGADYYGKLSRKDPYLLASFLEEAKRAGLEQTIAYSTGLNEFENLEADSVVFAGSEETVPKVKAEIARLNAAKPGAGYIIRTAKFSVAYITEKNTRVLEDLAEAMLRYGGKGCRSVAVVVSSFGLEDVKEPLRDAIKAFWKNNPPHLKPTPDLKYQYAYNKAVGRPQLWLKDFLIQESNEQPETDFTVHWMRGDEEKVRELCSKFANKIQSVYTAAEGIGGLETELLQQVQRPPLWWKPDGIDLLGELISSSS